MIDPAFQKSDGPFTVAHIRQLVDGWSVSDDGMDLKIYALSSLASAKEGCLVYLDCEKYLPALIECHATACLTTESLSSKVPNKITTLVVTEPKKAFVLVARQLYPERLAGNTVHTTSVISAGCSIGERTNVGPFSHISDGVQIGRGSRIGSHVYIGPGVSIGSNCRIDYGVSLEHCHIGHDVHIHPGARIGQAGFGFLYSAAGFEAIPQLGRVIIEDKCNIGANVTIDRGALDDTLIGSGTLIDNLVHVGHNVVIGKNCIIVAQTGVSGSVTLGNNVTLGGQVGIADHIKIGNEAQIAAKTGVISDVAAGEKMMGYPARPIKQFFREILTLRNLAKKRISKHDTT